MIYVSVKGIKPEEEGVAGGNGWHDVDTVDEAVWLELGRFHRMWDHLGYPRPITYTITVAPDHSPRRTSGGKDWPLPVEES